MVNFDMNRYSILGGDIMETKTIRFNIDISLEIQEYAIAASEKAEDILIDKWTVADYDGFIQNLILLLERNDFIVDENYESDRYDSLSRYILCHKKGDETNTLIKCVFAIRVSDHRLSKEGQQRQKAYWNSHINDKLATQLRKQIAKWKVKYIMLDDALYRTYDDVLDEVEYRLSEWR